MRSRSWKFLVYPVLAMAGLWACRSETPTEEASLVDRNLRVSTGSALKFAEEEILGGVFFDGIPTTNTGYFVRLVPLGGSAAVLDAQGGPGGNRMPVKPQGSRYPAKTTPGGMWGWYDPEAGDGPCNPVAPNRLEVHDLNLNGVPDGDEGSSPIEEHCAPAGPYRVELLGGEDGPVIASREIDKVRGSGPGKPIELPDATSGGSTTVIDNFVHFDLGGSFYNVNGTYAVDNPRTTAVNDTTGTTTDDFRFDALHTTTWNATNVSHGELSILYDWKDGSESRYTNTDLVIRVHRFDSNGSYPVQADIIHPGGEGIMDQTRTVLVQDILAAQAIGHTLPASIDVWEIVATSVTMKNTGSETWTTGAFALAQSPLWIWNPVDVGLSSAVASGVTRTINFNISTFEPEMAKTSQPNYWQMQKDGNLFFGDRPGRQTYVSGGSPLASYSLWSRAIAWLSPSAAMARNPFSVLAADEPLQVLRRVDYPLDTEALDRNGRTSIRYVASLAESWPVDFTFHLQLDPTVLKLGEIIKGVKGPGYDLTVDTRGWDVTIEAERKDGAGILPGNGLILEIPLVLKPNADVPSSLPLLELVTYR